MSARKITEPDFPKSMPFEDGCDWIAANNPYPRGSVERTLYHRLFWANQEIKAARRVISCGLAAFIFAGIASIGRLLAYLLGGAS